MKTPSILQFMENIIKTHNLTFSYGENRVLDNLNLEIPKGSIYGYLGPNGAGKTTTINLILKLLFPSEGNIFFFESDIFSLGKDYLKKVGSLIQPTPMYKYMTPKEQLRYLNYFYNVDNNNIDKILEEVGLYEHRNKKIKILSTGMKQKLAIAMALLHGPEILIFDEPTNGLDPNAIIDFRVLIKRLNLLGKTILMSSHIIGELEKCCTHIGIINKGSLLLQDKLENLREKAGSKMFIQTSDINKTKDILESLNTKEINIDHNVLICNIQGDKEFSVITKALSSKNIDIYDIRRQDFSLESNYLHLIK